MRRRAQEKRIQKECTLVGRVCNDPRVGPEVACRWMRAFYGGLFSSEFDVAGSVFAQFCWLEY